MTVLDIRREHPRNYTSRVFLDGVEQKLCTYADDELGIVERYELDELGREITTPSGWVTETLQGDVRIEEIK